MRLFVVGCFWVVVGLLGLPTVWAQSLEIIALQHRSAEQVLPQLAPFVDKNGMISGSGGQLFLRTSAKNQAEIKKMIAALDTPVRRLLISVRQAGGGEEADRGVGVGVGTGTRRPDAKIYSSDRNARRDVQQQVQTIDGGKASINVGQSLMIPLRQVVVTPAGAVISETLVQRDIGTGFVAIPRLSGDNVTLDLSPVDDVEGVVPGTVNRQHLVTSINGRLGEWIEVGGSTAGVQGNDIGVAVGTANYGTSYGTRYGTGYGTNSATRQSRILLKVDELR